MTNKAQRIYLDHHATTPVDPRVLEAMLPYFTEVFGNPASRSHEFGEQAALAVRGARRRVAQLVGATLEREIVFTSGATESNNLAIRGVFDSQFGTKRHIITSAIEHPCVLEAARWVEEAGGTWSRVGVDGAGLVSPDAVEAAIRPETALISIMWVNNEVGTIQPIAEIGAIAKRHGVLFHVDAAQAAGRVAIDVEACGIDLLSLSAHKLYGPKGVGALYVSARARDAIAPLLVGGGQEGRLRAGTLNVPGIVGLGAAAQLATEEMAPNSDRQRAQRQRLLDFFAREGLEPQVHGSLERRVAGNLNLTFPGIPGDALLNAVPALAMSAGSACSSTNPEVSHTLVAMGVSHRDARGAIRIGLGRFTSDEDVERAAQLIASAVRRLRSSLGPAPDSETTR